MENKSTIFSALIERLEDVLCKLQHINDNKLWTGRCLTNDSYRMHSNMKNLINSLVKKTINGKCQWEDLAHTDTRVDEFVEQPMFENHITSEEYIAESMKIQNAMPEIQVLLNSLLSLQELLGDTLDSSCQISNCPMKLSSGIFVHDLVRVNQQYESIWQFLNSAINLRAEDLPQTGAETCLVEVNLKLLRSIQSCFKEITKIKLEIEHYFKVNIIELQFSNSENEPNMLSHNYIPYADCTYFVDVQTFDNNSNTNENILQENMSSVITANGLVNPEICNLPSTIVSESTDQQHENSSYFLSSVKPWCDFKGAQNDYFSQPYIYPRDIVFFDPSVFIQSNVGNLTFEKGSKMYGMNSMEQRSNLKDDINYSNYEVIQAASEQKSAEIGQKPDGNEHYYDEKLFADNVKAERAYKKSIIIEENESVSSHIGQDSVNNKDLFDATPLMIEKSDHSYRNTLHNKEQFNVRQNDLEVEEPQLYDELTSGTKQLPQTQFFNRLGTLYPFETASNDDENVIFDPESLIEIFRSNKINIKSNSGSIEEGSSSFCLWPVAANYIYVSRSKKGNHLKPVSSEFSSSISENGLSNSLQPIYLNTNYQHQENYENFTGPDIFKENTNTSSCSFYNDSLALFGGDKQVKKNQITKPIFNETFNAFSRIKNTNVTCFNGGLKQLNNNFVQKTMAVQFADCGDSFVVKNKCYTKENIEILNGSSYTNNLNSFISIFTSNVGTDRQVNHHKMFRRTINSLGRRPITRDNLFNNVQTLTSNSGPYRLFDLNGYPLTDSAGNVLKDPYGKSLVDLDLTGFPKSEVKIFDAAGNTPKDVNFDPTQKPKTNTIVLKLTDNLKRPLHLFDKYGRPLTDSYGKLLVNIHGRPLLRFDNFGQPNTDYRGGPLYTENGFRWSPKNTRSQEELTNGTKSSKQIQSGSGNGFLDSFENISPGNDISNSNKQACTKEDINGNDVVNLSTSSSDIWSQLEIVLKNLPKKKKVEPTSSKTSVIVNNVSVVHNPFENDLMKSIIYLDNLVQEESNNMDTNVTLTDKMCNHCIKDFKTETTRENKINNMMLETKRNDIVQDLFLEIPNPAPFPFQRDAFKRACSKCLVDDTLVHQQDCRNNKTVISNYNSGDACLSEDLSPKTGNDRNIKEAQTHLIKHDTSKVFQQHRNEHCLYNLHNEVFSNNYKKYEDKINSPLYSVTTNGQRDSTDVSLSQLTSTGLSKYTTDMLTTSDSPMTIIDSSAQSSNQLQQLQDYNNYLKDKHGFDFHNIKKISKDNYINYSKNYHCHQELLTNISTVNFDNNKRDVLQLPYKKVHLPSYVASKNDRLYELKIADMILKSLENDANKLKEENKTLPFRRETVQKECPVQVHSNLEYRPKENDLNTQINYNELSNGSIKLGKIQDLPEKTYDSPFRFSPDNEANKVKDIIEVKYIREGSGEMTSNISVKASETISDQSLHEHKVLHANKIQSIEQFQNKNLTMNENYYGCVSKMATPAQHGKDKIDQRKKQYFRKKYVHTAEKVTPTNKECNLVSFLGSPVKYVLNKLDLTSSRQKPNRMYRLPKKTNKPHPIDAHNHGDNNDYKNRNNDMLKDRKEKSDKIGQTSYIEKEKLLAFRSKSCIAMFNKNIPGTMSYSGNEETFQNNTHSTEASPVQAEIRRYSSAICYLFEKCEDDTKNKDRNNKLIMNKPKRNEPYSFKINHSKKKNENRDANHNVLTLQKAIPGKAEKYTGNHSCRNNK